MDNRANGNREGINRTLYHIECLILVHKIDVHIRNHTGHVRQRYEPNKMQL